MYRIIYYKILKIKKKKKKHKNKNAYSFLECFNFFFKSKLFVVYLQI